jgi:hypothetical protein
MATASVSDAHGLEVRRGAAGWLGLAGGLALGLVLLVAAGAKALDPRTFGEGLAALGWTGPMPAVVAAVAALAVETLIGALLVANLRRVPVLLAATALVAFFLFVTGREAWRAAHGDEGAASACGCFGNLVDRTPAEAFRQDLLMLVPALALAWLGRPGATGSVRARSAGAGAAALAVAGFAAVAPGLPLDRWATRLSPGVEIASLCAGRGAARVCLAGLAPELAAGRHLVLIVDAADPGFEALARELNARARAGTEPPVAVLAELAPERSQELFWTVAPAFELHDVPRALLRPLYRTLPRSFLVEGGRVTATWTGLPGDLAVAREPR